MQDYEVHRTVYHDVKDTLGNINLNYGASLEAIAIETVARTATRRDISPLAVKL